MDDVLAAQRHYAVADLTARLRAALAAAGKNPDRLDAADLAPLDELHLHGRAATSRLLGLLGAEPVRSALDVGCGLGGPARTLAREFGGAVVGIDVAPEFLSTARYLSESSGACGVSFVQGDALQLPLREGAFDLALMQHVHMHVRDHNRLFGEMARVLAPGGRLGLHEPVRRDHGSLAFPVPWASDPGASHLAGDDELQAAIAQAGLRIEAWQDMTDETTAWLSGSLQRLNERPPALWLQLVMRHDLLHMLSNVLAGLESGALGVLMAVARKP